jgi:hypothetical protein
MSTSNSLIAVSTVTVPDSTRGGTGAAETKVMSRFLHCEIPGQRVELRSRILRAEGSGDEVA